jgi:hypothetical protein
MTRKGNKMRQSLIAELIKARPMRDSYHADPQVWVNMPAGQVVDALVGWLHETAIGFGGIGYSLDLDTLGDLLSEEQDV